MNTCVYLNLPAATARRASVEASFAAVPNAGWTLSRFDALGPDAVAGMPGPLTPAEKGCFASHRAAIGGLAADEGNLLVTEDDVQFSSKTFAVLDALLARGLDWDILFLDVGLCDLAMMLQLARRHEGMTARSEFNLADLRGRSWAGATAYCIPSASKAKVFGVLQAAELDRPYDLHLRALADQGGLKMGFCFPFLTTVSPRARVSQIQADEHAVFDMTLNAFRRLMFVERDLEQCRRDSAELRDAVNDEGMAMIGTVFGAIASPVFPFDR